MERVHRARLAWAAAGSLALLNGCSGGGGISNTPPATSPTPTPTSAPAPTPTPTPTPTPATNYNTAEYQATVGAVSMNALTAYTAGATGNGVKVGIIDSGIDLQSQEFGNRISPASADTAGNGTIDDEGGHGTAVAFTLAGRRNGAGTQGVAFDATLIVLRTDTPGSCAVIKNGDPQCSHSDTAIAQAVDIAVNNGARVINISLGGSSPNYQLVQAFSRATQAGVIVVIAAGNEYDTDPVAGANPDPFAAVAADTAISHGLIVIAGSVDAAGQISTFSNRAGADAAYYLAAVGENVRAPNQNDVPYLWSGTSFSAPQISGAIALLAQAFPNLTGAQIVDLLYRTARDAGAAGIDSVYGHGVLDLTHAFDPVGAMSVAGSAAPASLTINGTLSAPMGDASQSALGAILLDGFSRAYATDLARTINHQGPVRTLAGALASRTRDMIADARGMSVAVSIRSGRERTWINRMQLAQADAESARVLAASVTARLGGRMSFAIGSSESGSTLAARLAGRADPAFLVAHDPTVGTGFDSMVGGAAAMRRRFGRWGITVSAEHGDVLNRRAAARPALAGRQDRFGYNRLALAFDRRFGGLRTALSAAWLGEDRTLLGAYFTGALGAPRATSLFVDASARYDFGADWSIGASWRRGWTRALLNGGVGGSGHIRSGAFAFDLGKQGLLAPADRFGLRVAQPLRVAQGGLDLRLPSGWDYASMAVTEWSTRRLNLAPRGREMDFELAYGRPLGRGTLDTNVFLRHQPGNYAALPADYGTAVRWSLGF